MKLVWGDAIDAMLGMRETVDAVIVDPPYGVTGCSWDAPIPMKEMWEAVHTVLKPHGVVVLFGAEPFSSAVRMSNAEEYKYDLVWDKVVPSGMQVARYRPMTQHENIMVFGSGKSPYHPQMVLRDKPIKGYASKRSGASPVGEVDQKMRTYTHKNPTSILRFKRVSGRSKPLHPTQKPVDLMEYLVRTFTDEGQVVLDFAMGSGTTGEACLNTGREFIGIELDENMYEVAKNRLTR